VLSPIGPKPSRPNDRDYLRDRLETCSSVAPGAALALPETPEFVPGRPQWWIIRSAWRIAAMSTPGPPDEMDDALTRLLRGLRMHARLDYVGGVCSPWAIDHNSATAIWFHLVTKGDSFVHSGTWPSPQRLDEGDLILFLPHAPKHYLAWSTDTPVFGLPGAAKVPLQEGSTGFVCGLFELAHPQAAMWRALPGEILVRAHAGGDGLAQLVRLILAEAKDPGFASRSLIERLFDSSFVLILRHCVETKQVRAGVFAAFQDRALAKVLGLMHAEPARAWTVPELAERAALSKTVLNERFAAVVGVAPMHYLAAWRMQCAGEWLLARGASIGQVAERCGYESASAFSRMFKRHHGVSPGAYRRGLGSAVAS
jgi:AraC-like DNA-binding protein